MSRPEVERVVRSVGPALSRAMPPGIGFTVLIYELGDGPGHMAYASSGERLSTIRLLREFCDKFEHGDESHHDLTPDPKDPV